MFNNQLTLVKREFKNDGLQDIPIETRKEVLCKVQSVKRYEFYKMRETGIKPELIFIVKGYEYENEDTVEFNEVTYKVIRTYQIDFEETELVCERLTGNG